ncbi:MAG: tyrosine--tRNA ligase [Candidatus Gastranaerophilales bacterium]|nr:tyrosine--tRNA ligase [Candidatus Gastranaerophilales bacterium]
MEKITPREEFLTQAKELARACEVLPGGVDELALKLQKAHDENRPLRIKLGLDPTRPDLHLGHSVVMRKLKQFQDLGHQVVLIVGGATAMVGDPSGKSNTRPSLTKEEVDENAKTYFDQMGKIVDMEKSEVTNNATWLHPLGFADMLKLASKITVAQMMARDDFAKRYSEGKPISVHEFFYPLMQAYDSVVVESDIELGGTDQRFNVLLGREIQLAYGAKKEPQMVMLLPLLEGTDGVIKMSKSYPENCISITEAPNDMYGKLMSIPDELIIRYYELLTDISNPELEIIKSRLKTENPRNIKMELALKVTELYNGVDVAQKAQENFINVVQKKCIPDDIQQVTVENGASLLDLIVEIGFAQSKGEAKRLFQGGAVKLDGEKIADISKNVDFGNKNEIILQSGKRNFAKLILKA